ncbi:MAG: permease-like cell division protein FtsX, partial [Clostridia bacterium]|nr:permease-like cell division protein FtsX [Clostridia bacterium]
MIYCLKEAFLSIYRNSWLSIASIGTIFISLVILGFSLLFIYNANDLGKSVEEQMEIEVFLLDEMADSEVETMQQELEKQKHITQVDFTRKEEGMEILRGKLGDSQALVKGLERIDNPVPRSFTLKVDDAKIVADTAHQVEEMEGVEAVSYGQGTVEKVVNIIYWFRIIGIVIIAILVVAALLLIS